MGKSVSVGDLITMRCSTLRGTFCSLITLATPRQDWTGSNPSRREVGGCGFTLSRSHSCCAVRLVYIQISPGHIWTTLYIQQMTYNALKSIDLTNFLNIFMCFPVNFTNGGGQVSPVRTMAFRRNLLSLSGCVQFRIMCLCVCVCVCVCLCVLSHVSDGPRSSPYHNRSLCIPSYKPAKHSTNKLNADCSRFPPGEQSRIHLQAVWQRRPVASFVWVWR